MPYEDPRPTSQDVGSTEGTVLKDNLITLDTVMNAESGTEITNRKGESLLPLVDIVSEATNIIQQVADDVASDTDQNTGDISTLQGEMTTAQDDITTLQSEAITNMQAAAVSLGIGYDEIILSTDLTSAIPTYIFVVDGNVTYSVPSDAQGKFIDVVTGALLTTTDATDYTLLSPARDLSGGTFTNISSLITRSLSEKFGDEYNVKDYGATGDGTTNDSPAFQLVFDAILAAGIGTMYIPQGRYNLEDGIVYNDGSTGTNTVNMSIKSDGQSTVLYHTAQEALFTFIGTTTRLTVQDITVYSKRLSIDATEALFYFPNGNSKSNFSNIWYSVESGGTAASESPSSFYYCETGEENDSVNFSNCYISGITTVGYNIGVGSSIYILGGRVIGTWNTLGYNSVGIHFSGGNGGCYVWANDCIRHYYTLRISKDSGASNREMFLTHFVSDYSAKGVRVEDESYTTWTGVWAASGDDTCIDYSPSSDSSTAILELSGGTVFNAGTPSIITNSTGVGVSHNGNGRVLISDIAFRDNDGRAFSSAGTGTTHRSSIKDCDFKNNASTEDFNSQVYLSGYIAFEDNNFYDGDEYPILLDATAANIVDLSIQNNTLISGTTFGIVPDATGVTMVNETGYHFDAYIRGGSVNSVYVNSNPVYVYTTAQEANVVVHLRPGDTWSIAYSQIPSVRAVRT